MTTPNGMRNDGGNDEPLDPRAAMELLAETRAHAERALDVRTDLLYAAWGLVWLVGVGAMYLSVRSQDPYRGPSVWSGTLMGALVVLAIAATAMVTARATHGIGGDAAVQGAMYGTSWFVGFVTLFLIEAGLARHGASDVVMGIIGAAGPMLVIGLVYMGGGAIWRDRTMFFLGILLSVLAACGALSGPVTLLLIECVGGGLGFLAAAAHVRMRRERG